MFYLKKLTSFMFLERGIVSLVNLTKKEESGIFKTEKSDIGKKNNPDNDKTNDTGIVKKDHKFSGGRCGLGEKNVDNFLLNLYKEVSVEKRWQSDELSDLKSATKEMVNRIVNEAVSPFMKEDKSKGLTEVIVSEAGSMADGTSIIDPDEFDFTMAFVFSPNTIKARPSTNEKEFSFNFKVKPHDQRFKQIRVKNELVRPYEFVQQNFHRLEDAFAKARDDGPVERGDKSLSLCSTDGNNTYYGMQGPSFHLHNLLKWHSPNRPTDLFISVDLVPAIQLNDKTMAKNISLFKQRQYPCGEQNLRRPEHCLLMPLKCRYFFTTKIVHDLGEGDDIYWKDKMDFLESHFMISFSEYETDLLKQWKCEKSMYHNWYICYTLMKCFGNLDHASNTTLTIRDNEGQLSVVELQFPERNERFSSYSWKNMVFTKAMKEGEKPRSLSQCFNSLTSEFEEDNLKNLQLIEIESFCWPSKIAEIVDIRERNSRYTPFAKRMIQVKSMLNEIKADPNYCYEKYKKRLMEIFPKLKPHL